MRQISSVSMQASLLLDLEYKVLENATDLQHVSVVQASSLLDLEAKCQIMQ